MGHTQVKDVFTYVQREAVLLFKKHYQTKASRVFITQQHCSCRNYIIINCITE